MKWVPILSSHSRRFTSSNLQTGIPRVKTVVRMSHDVSVCFYSNIWAQQLWINSGFKHYWGLLQRDAYKAITSLATLSEVRKFWHKTLLNLRKCWLFCQLGERQGIAPEWKKLSWNWILSIHCNPLPSAAATTGSLRGDFFLTCQVDGRKDVKEEICKKWVP